MVQQDDTRGYIENWNGLTSNPTRCLAWLWGSALLCKVPSDLQVKLQCQIVLRKDFPDILKNQMLSNSLENFYHLIHTARNNKKWKHFRYIHFVILKECIVYVHMQIPKNPCFACLSIVIALEVNTSNTRYFWIPR